MSRVLVVSPHPDDESIGCGGTLRLHSLAGDDVRVVFLTSGENGGWWVESPQELIDRRQAEAARAAEILGVGQIEFWREPDAMLRASGALVARLASVLGSWKPDLLYAPHTHEDSPDHRAAARAVLRALRALSPERRPVARFFEVWTPVSRVDAIVDISDVLDAKIAAIRAHESQCEIMRFDEAAVALARYRGEMHCWPGGDYAEAFLVDADTRDGRHGDHGGRRSQWASVARE